MSLRYTSSAGIVPGALLLLAFAFDISISDALAQNKQGLGPGGSRLTHPAPPSSGTGFGPNTGFGSGSSSSSGSGVPAGTKCVSIQCADGTVIPCNSSCPRPSTGAVSPVPSGGGYTTPQYGQPQQPARTDAWNDDDARRREAEARQRREAAERARTEEFARGRDEALQLLRGVSGTELGIRGGESDTRLRGLDTARATEAAKPDCGPSANASVVNLCHLNPNKPIVVDIATARGKRRFQVSQKTLDNESYKSGFDAIRAADYATAVQHFRKAQHELGNDLMVYNGLALAEDLLKMQKQKAKMEQARREFADGYAAMLRGDFDTAITHLQSAVRLDPNTARYRDDMNYVLGMRSGVRIANQANRESQQRAMAQKAFEVAEKSIGPWMQGDWASVIAILQLALVVNPGDPFVLDTLDLASGAQKRKALAAAGGRQ